MEFLVDLSVFSGEGNEDIIPNSLCAMLPTISTLAADGKGKTAIGCLRLPCVAFGSFRPTLALNRLTSLQHVPMHHHPLATCFELSLSSRNEADGKLADRTIMWSGLDRAEIGGAGDVSGVCTGRPICYCIRFKRLSDVTVPA